MSSLLLFNEYCCELLLMGVISRERSSQKGCLDYLKIYGTKAGKGFHPSACFHA